ncbi:MAG: hypothetical protein IKL84_01975 [Clostridia bacterium]|nr:hypothetical protein [Clostridia bacterium]
MKEYKLADAIGEIDSKFICEAGQTAPARRRIRGGVLLIAALLAVSLCIVGFTIAGKFYYAPGIGIVSDDSAYQPRVLANFEEGMMLGDFEIEGVTMGETGKGYELIVWFKGNFNAYFSPHSYVFTLNVNGTEYDTRPRADANFVSSELHSRGLSSLSLSRLPESAEQVIIGDHLGNKLTVPLTPIAESRWAYLNSLQLPGGRTLTLVPVGNGDSIFYNRFIDPMIDQVREQCGGWWNPSLTFRTLHEDGSIGWLKGSANDVLKLSGNETGSPIVEIALDNIRFTILDSPSDNKHPPFSLPCPAEGERITCDATLFAVGDVKIRLTAVERRDGNLYLTYACDGENGLTENAKIINEIEVYVSYDGNIPKNEGYLPFRQIVSRGVSQHDTQCTLGGEVYTLKPGDPLLFHVYTFGFIYTPADPAQYTFFIK